jgi:hypothetical protein
MARDEEISPLMQCYWQPYAFWICIIASLCSFAWFMRYSYLVSKPIKKIRLFSTDINSPIDSELTYNILIRGGLLALATFSGCVSIIYCFTDVWIIAFFPMASRVALGAGACFLFFQSKKTSVAYIHEHFRKKQDRVEGKNEEKRNE